MKNWKSLFVKDTETETAQKEPKEAAKKDATESFSFPVSEKPSFQTGPAMVAAVTPTTTADPAVKEVLDVYESGLDSINMPGYDFYEFYKAISSIGQANEHTYQLAYQMAKSLDKTVTTQKLMTDAEFYISKINEVHGQYVNQGQSKLNSLQEKKNTDKNKLQSEIDAATARITQLRAELQQLEADTTQKRFALAKTDENFYPQEKAIREKLMANDMARKVSIDKLNSIKDGILKYIKA
jgi:polyhydroxyalkanoate synthesis regulator phasin